jgi:hypothetical protein
MFAFYVFSLLTTKLSIWFQIRWRNRKKINALCLSFTWLRPLMSKVHMLLLMPMMITAHLFTDILLVKLRQPIWVMQIWDESSLLCCVQWLWARVYYNWPDYQEQVYWFHGACYKKYNSYEEGNAGFKSRINTNPPLAHDDDFYLQSLTTAPPSLSFKTIVIVVLLIFICLLWKKLWAHVLIISMMVRLDLTRIIMVTAPLTTTLV